VKIIENFSDLEAPSMFPLMGTGQSYQVHYEEVLLPPKTELTSLVPSKENWFRFQMKEEERKRVAIRRAEYANRTKGLAKTVVTTFGLGEHSQVFMGEESENLEIQIENREKMVMERKSSLKNQMEKGKGKKNGKFEKSQERGRSLESGKGKGFKYVQKIRDESLKRNLEQSKVSVKHKLLAKFTEKNFAQLINVGEKDEQNEKLMTSENSVVDDEDEQKVKVQDSFNIFESLEMPEKPVIQDVPPQQNKGNDSTFIKSFEDSYNLSETLDFSIKSPETQDENLKDLPERPKSNQALSSQRSSPLIRIEEGSENSSDHLQTLEKEESPEKTTEKFQNSAEISEKFSKTQENLEKIRENEKNSEKSLKNDSDKSCQSEECPSNEEIVFSSKSIEESIKRESREMSLSKEKEKSYEEFEEVKKRLEFVGNPFENSPQGQDYSENDQEEEKFSADFSHQISFEDISQINNLTIHDQSSLTIFTAANDEQGKISEKKDETLEMKDDMSEKSDEIGKEEGIIGKKEEILREKDEKRGKKEEIIGKKEGIVGNKEEIIGKKEEITEKKEENDENQLPTFRDNQSQQEELKNPSPKPEEISEASPEEEDLKQRLLQLLCILSDPQVIKGLKLLGGFADYLERFGKDILDIK
jgi:hypothetical protein